MSRTILNRCWVYLSYLQTGVSGRGMVVVTIRGPVEVIHLEKGWKIAVDGRVVVCRTEDVAFRIVRSTRSLSVRLRLDGVAGNITPSPAR